MGGLMDPAVCWGLAIGSHQHHKQCFLPLSIGENIALCAESIHGLTLSRCLLRPVPLPAEEACKHVVGSHIRAISKPKKNILWGLEMVCKGASIGLQIDDGW